MVYYRVLLEAYKVCGWFGDRHATNSSWTDGHITQMWGKRGVKKIYPPCDTSDIISQTNLDQPRENILVSFAQFRPEKDHALQVRVWKNALPKLPADAKFYMIGATRGPDDEAIVEALKDMCRRLGVNVEFMINKPRNEILELFQRAKVAIHTMKEEHFGISIVEMMSAGLIVIAHDSAGPKMDIIGAARSSVGYLATDETQYTQMLLNAMNLFDNQTHREMRQNARTHVVDEFGVAQFNTKFVSMI